MITLKRFAFARSSRKVDRYVDFPLEGLDLGPFVAHAGGEAGRADLTYDLLGVVNHFGAAGYGHYTAVVRDLFAVGGPGPWLRCDDSSVAEVPADDVRSSAAYVLFYARRERSGGALGPVLPSNVSLVMSVTWRPLGQTSAGASRVFHNAHASIC